MDHNYTAEYEGILIRPLKRGDIDNLRVWRNDEGTSKYLRPINYITPEMQEKWFEEYLTDKNNITFAIEERVRLHRMVGSVSLYDFFGGDKAEVGKIVLGDVEARGTGAAFKGESLAIHVGFQKLKIESFITRINTDNEKSKNLAVRLGFKTVKELPIDFGIGKEYFYTMTKDDFYTVNPGFSNILINQG